MVPLAIGTDGGGSIRIPSAFCETTGLKPTFGLIPKMPGVRGWPTLSVTGPIATDVRDLALAATVMAEPSSSDPLTYPSPSGDYLGALDERGWSGLRVASIKCRYRTPPTRP
jgi:Asp-tRNA(Asn)/Glu-tRNA(Gln) amidotransferase A subunit family amidase